MKIADSFYSSGSFEQRTRDFFGEESGLPSNNALCVAYDSKGRLWAGTDKGAACFDGKCFKPVSVGKASAKSPVEHLLCDAAGKFYACSGSKVYLLKGSSFALLGEANSAIIDIACLGEAVFALTDDSIWTVETDGVKFMGGEFSGAVAFAPSNGNFYVATDKSLLVLAGKRLHWKSIFPSMTSMPSFRINKLSFDSLGYLWVATDRGLFIYDNKSLWVSPDASPSLPAEEIFGIAADKEGAHWLSSDCGVIYEKNGSLKYLGSRRWVPDSKVNCIAVADDCKTAWAATSKGLSCISVTMTTLAEKAARYQADTEKYHTRDGYVTCREGITGEDMSSGRVQISDNDGLWTGKYVASQCFRYAVTGEKAALENARRSMKAMLYLMSVTGIPGFTARAIRREGEFGYGDGDPEWVLAKDGSCEWKCETSSDEMTGHFFTASIYYDLCADKKEKAEISKAICAIVDHIERSGFALIDHDGKPTTWANWNPDSLNYDDRWVWERGVNSLELLAFIKVAYHMSGNKHYDELYQKMINEHHYALNIVNHKRPDGHTCHIDDNLGFLSATTLLRLEDNPDIRRLVLMGMEHHFEYEKIERTPFWNIIYAAFTGRDECLGDAVQALRELPLSLIAYEIVNSNRRGLVYDDEQEFWGEPTQLKNPLPVDERPLGKYDANPFSFDGGNGTRAEDGTMYLLPYWFARYYGLIKESGDK